MNTPYLWGQIRQRRLRLTSITGIISMQGTTVIRDYLNAQDENGYGSSTPVKVGCVATFLYEIISYRTDAGIQFGSWIICVVALFMTFIRQWTTNYASRTSTKSLQALLQFLRIQSTTENHANATITLNTEAQPTIQPSSQTRSRVIRYFTILFQTHYVVIYICLQALPVYYLWRMWWMRRQIRSIIQPPAATADILYPPFANFTFSIAEASKTWDNDNWSFGQILTLSIWYPPLLEFLYMLFGKSRSVFHFPPLLFLAVSFNYRSIFHQRMAFWAYLFWIQTANIRNIQLVKSEYLRIDYQRDGKRLRTRRR